MQTYTLRDIRSTLGLSRAVIGGLIAAGFVKPARGPRREYRFSFQDMVLLRTAQELQRSRIPARRIVQSLRRLRATLPETLPLTGLRITAVGSDVVVRDGGAPCAADSGQMLFDFEIGADAGAAGTATAAASAKVRALRPLPAMQPDTTPTVDTEADAARAPAPRAAGTPWLQRGIEFEARDAGAAEAAYRHAIAEVPGQADAYLNLGVLLGAAGRHREAAAVYRQGLEHCPGEALLHFNLGVALEDTGQPDAAIRAYERSLALDADLADAHFNIARLHDQLGRAKQAIRHYSAYRRLEGLGGGPGTPRGPRGRGG
ncbi:MAG: tetratricopeptide repeat protein [Rubrivivax sp.]|nr:tetratricopeptide repeat protein [Rubrivivax sp.]